MPNGHSTLRLSKLIPFKTVKAIHYVRRMHGSSQSQLMLCSDGNLYIVKFRNNPQHRRVLCNEMLGTQIARFLGLPVPPAAIIEVSQKLIDKTPAMRIDLSGATVAFEPGLHFASRHVLQKFRGEVYDFFPSKKLHLVANLQDFAGALAFDLWTCNADARQAIFTRPAWMSTYHATFIDQGNCFNGQDWDRLDQAFRGVYRDLSVYSHVSPRQVSRWASRIRDFDMGLIRAVCDIIPTSWYDNEHRELENLVERLEHRRQGICEVLHKAFSPSTGLPVGMSLAQFLPLGRKFGIECGQTANLQLP